MITVLLCLSLFFGLAACSVTDKDPQPDILGEQTSDADASASGEAVAASISCPVNMTPSEFNNYPYMGISLHLSERILDAVLDNVIFMRPGDDVEYTDLAEMNQVPPDWQPTAENTVLHGGYVEFLFLPEGMRDRAPHIGMENPMSYEEYMSWITEAIPMARIEMFRKSDFQEDVLEQDGFTNHVKLGENTKYIYYLSTTDSMDGQTKEAKKLYSAIQDLGEGVTVFEAKALDESYYGITTPEVIVAEQVGDFQAQTLDGEDIDESIFANAKLTVINVWTTWCGSCVDEMPDLEAISEMLGDIDAQLIGIAYDTCDPRGQINEEMLELANEIIDRTGVTFPTLIPDEHLMNGLLKGMLGYPTTFFVDAQGNLVGEPVLGSNSAKDWVELIQERVAAVNG